MGELGSGTGTSYPTTLDNDIIKEVNSPNAGKTKARAEVINDLGSAVVAIEAALGTTPQGSKTDVKTFLQVEHNADGTHQTSKIVTAASFQAGSYIFATAGGTADALIASFTPSLASLTAGMVLYILAIYANATTTPTINPSALGAITINRRSGTALTIGDIQANKILELVYDGTAFNLLNPHNAMVFGTWDSSSYSINTTYQATTDGVVEFYAFSSGTSNVVGYTDSANPPTTERTGDYSSTNQPLGCSMHVRKGDYWKLTVTGSYSTLKVNWLPFNL